MTPAPAPAPLDPPARTTPSSPPDARPDSTPASGPDSAPDFILTSGPDSAPDSTPASRSGPAPDFIPTSGPDSAPDSAPASGPDFAVLRALLRNASPTPDPQPGVTPRTHLDLRSLRSNPCRPAADPRLADLLAALTRFDTPTPPAPSQSSAPSTPPAQSVPRTPSGPPAPSHLSTPSTPSTPSIASAASEPPLASPRAVPPAILAAFARSAAATAAAADQPDSAPHASSRPRTLSRELIVLSSTALLAVLASTVAAAADDALPSPAQRVAHAWFGSWGVPAPGRRAAASASPTPGSASVPPFGLPTTGGYRPGSDTGKAPHAQSDQDLSASPSASTPAPSLTPAAPPEDCSTTANAHAAVSCANVTADGSTTAAKDNPGKDVTHTDAWPKSQHTKKPH